VATGDPPDNATPTNPITPVVPAAPVPPPPTPVIASYTVGSGDNLWRIAAAHLAVETGRPIQQLRVTDIETYWSRVVSQNRSHLRSRNPDLIFAGEVIVLPRLVEQPE
jgi:nucleoid-associated protein YgaU